jgi:hypothetical protein
MTMAFYFYFWRRLVRERNLRNCFNNKKYKYVFAKVKFAYYNRPKHLAGYTELRRKAVRYAKIVIEQQKENKSEQALQIIGHVVAEFYVNKR